MESLSFRFIFSDFEVGISYDSKQFAIRNGDAFTIYDDIDEFLSDFKSYILKCQESNK